MLVGCRVKDDGGTATITSSDGQASTGVDTSSPSATLNITVQAVNDRPIGADKTVTAPENGAYSFSNAATFRALFRTMPMLTAGVDADLATVTASIPVANARERLSRLSCSSSTPSTSSRRRPWLAGQPRPYLAWKYGSTRSPINWMTRMTLAASMPGQLGARTL